MYYVGEEYYLAIVETPKEDSGSVMTWQNS